jgi:SAM-dependent methyltransferase
MAMTRRERTLRLLPPPIKAAAKQLRHSADPIFVKAYRRRTGDLQPIPPSAIRARSGSPSITSYIPGGASAADELNGVLNQFGHSFGDFESVYDFGCGAGRVLRHVARRGGANTTYSGSDVDSGAIAWAQEHLPEAQFKVSQYRPPLPYDDGSFDCVYSISIFTHLNESMQMDWLRDLHRVMRPGAYGVLTIHGNYAYEECRSGRVVSNTRGCSERISNHGDLKQEGFIYEGYEISNWNQRDFPGIDDTFGMTFHSQDYVKERWSEVFEVLGIAPQTISDGWQDSVVVRKRD